jgi:hypothetical protein
LRGEAEKPEALKRGEILLPFALVKFQVINYNAKKQLIPPIYFLIDLINKDGVVERTFLYKREKYETSQ